MHQRTTTSGGRGRTLSEHPELFRRPRGEVADLIRGAGRGEREGPATACTGGEDVQGCGWHRWRWDAERTQDPQGGLQSREVEGVN